MSPKYQRSDLFYRLLAAEYARRQERSMLYRLRQAKIPFDWTLESFPFKNQPVIDKRPNRSTPFSNSSESATARSSPSSLPKLRYSIVFVDPNFLCVDLSGPENKMRPGDKALAAARWRVARA